MHHTHASSTPSPCGSSPSGGCRGGDFSRASSSTGQSTGFVWPGGGWRTSPNKGVRQRPSGSMVRYNRRPVWTFVGTIPHRDSGWEITRRDVPTMTSYRSLVGSRFGRLVILAYLPRCRRMRTWARFSCQCDCGKMTVVNASVLLKANGTRSCRCLAAEESSKRMRTHGLSLTSEWRAWRNMRVRCQVKTHHAYQRYGGRGIRVCRRWLVFENFLADMGPKAIRRIYLGAQEQRRALLPQQLYLGHEDTTSPQQAKYHPAGVCWASANLDGMV